MEPKMKKEICWQERQWLAGEWKERPDFHIKRL